MSFATNIVFGPAAEARPAATSIPLVWRMDDSEPDANTSVVSNSNLNFTVWADGVQEANLPNRKVINHLFVGATQKLMTMSMANWADVLEIDLSNQSLIDVLPKQLGRMTNLRKLELSVNGMEGPFISELWTLTALQHLSLSQNSFQGSLPADIGNLVNLTYLELGNCGITDPIPANFWTLNKLKHFSLQANSIAGTIPTTLANLIDLEFINLGNNNFTGPVPEHLKTLTNLESVILFRNNFSSYVPGTFSNLPLLTSLDLNINNLSQTDIDNILADLVASLSLPGRPPAGVGLAQNSPPSSSGLADVATLQSAGWSINHD